MFVAKSFSNIDIYLKVMNNKNMPEYELHQELSDILCVNKAQMGYFMHHFHKKFEMYYVLEDVFKININDNEYLLTADEIAFVPSFYPHYGYESNSIAYRIILPHTLTGDVCSLFKEKTLPCSLCDKEFNRNIILPIIQSFADSINKDKNIISKGYINLFLGNLFYHYNTVKIETGQSIELIVKVLKYIDENYKDKITLEDISKMFGYNKFYFSRMFNKMVKMNLNDYINFVRIQKFFSFYESDISLKVTELAFDCGFDSLTTFYRAFNNHFHESPKTMFKK